MAKVRLISFHICPFVQRAAIALEAKGVDYDIEYISLSDKPRWFLDISPLGKVPLLDVGGTILFESQVIAEYLDETVGDPMHPRDPLRRAQHRAMIELISNAVSWTWQASITPDESTSREAIAKVRDALQRLQAARGVGVYFDGDALSLTDAAAAPMLQRLSWADEVGEFGVFDDLPEISTWRDALLAHPAVQSSAVADIRDRSIAAYQGWLGSVRDAR